MLSNFEDFEDRPDRREITCSIGLEPQPDWIVLTEEAIDRTVEDAEEPLSTGMELLTLEQISSTTEGTVRTEGAWHGVEPLLSPLRSSGVHISFTEPDALRLAVTLEASLIELHLSLVFFELAEERSSAAQMCSTELDVRISLSMLFVADLLCELELSTGVESFSSIGLRTHLFLTTGEGA